MSLEEQLEFPFLEKLRNKLYAEKQREEMKSLYTISYARDGDYGKGMKFGDFIADIWIKQGLAEQFRAKYHKIYFYDSKVSK